MNEAQRILVINNYLRDNNIELLITNDIDEDLQVLESISETFLLSKWNDSDISELDGLNNFLQENFQNVPNKAKKTLLEIRKDIYDYLKREYPNQNLNNLKSRGIWSCWSCGVLDWCLSGYILGSWLIDMPKNIDEAFKFDFEIE